MSARNGFVACGVFIASFLAACSEEDGFGLRSRSSHRNDETSSSTDAIAESNGTGANAEALFAAVQPKLSSSCGPCHVTGSGSAPVWLAPEDPYNSAKLYKGIVTSNADASILLTKGAHVGPAMPASVVPGVKAWIEAEAKIVVAKPDGVTTSAQALPDGATTITLPSPGGSITFIAALDGSVLTLRQVTLTSPVGKGVRATGIHLVVLHADDSSTTDDSLADSDVTAAKDASTTIGVGLVVMPRIASSDRFQIHIDALTAVGEVTTTGGCKDVATFQKTAAPALMSNTCLTCHDKDGSGYGALDLSALALETPDFAKACGQAKSKVDLANVANSQLITAPSGGIASHPYKSAPAAFKTAMTTWIDSEK